MLLRSRDWLSANQGPVFPASVKCVILDQIAANCWEWTVAQRPEFETQLLMEIIAAWRWTVNARVGLFAPTVLPSRPVNTDSKVQEADKAPDCEPHRIWIRFLTQRFEVGDVTQ